MSGPDRSSIPAPRDGTLPRNKRRRGKRAKPVGAPVSKARIEREPSASTVPSTRRLFIAVSDANLQIVPPAVRAKAAALPVEVPARDEPLAAVEEVRPDPAPERRAETGPAVADAPAPVVAMPEVADWDASPVIDEKLISDESPVAAGEIPASNRDAADPKPERDALAAVSVETPAAVPPAADAEVPPSPVQNTAMSVKRRMRLGLVAAAGVAAGIWLALPEPDASPVGLLSKSDASVSRAASAAARLRLVAADTLAPAETPTLAPQLATAAYGTDDLVAASVLAPTGRERVTARAATRADLLAPAPGRKPPPKPTAATAAAQSRPAASEAGRREPSRGAILDFLSGVLSD